MTTRIVLAILLSVLSVGFAPAATVLTFQSHPTSLDTATSQVGSNAGLVMGLVPNSAWHTPSGTTWVSPWPSGDPSLPGFFSPANGTTVTFGHDFKLPDNFVVTGSTLVVLADDTATGFINGVQIFPAGTVQLPHCTNPPGCTLSTMWTGNVPAVLFQAGWNKLEFAVPQLYGESFGANWKLTVEGNSVPEPGTFALMGAALIGLGFRKLRPDRRS